MDNPLLQAIIAKDFQSVEKFKAYKNQKDSYGYTALEIAYLLNQKESIKILDPNASFSNSLEKFHVKYVNNLVFSSYKDFVHVLHILPLYFRFFGEKKAFKGQLHHTCIQWIDEEIGYGLFAKKNFSKGEILGEYTGLVKRFNPLSPNHNPYCFFYPTAFYSKDIYFIDAKNYGNETRFLNHSDYPNLSLKYIVDRKLLHLIFITTQKIKKGQELTFNYGSDYWRFRKKIHR